MAPAWLPFTQTVVRQSLAPKLSWTRRPFQPAGTVKVRLYQSLSFWVILRWIPERADSATNGTRICSENEAGWPASAEVTAKSQMPLRLAQSGRVSCGRGYSGSGLSTDTWLVHGVVMGEGLGVHAAGAACTVPVAVRAAVQTNARVASTVVIRLARCLSQSARGRGAGVVLRIVTPWVSGARTCAYGEKAGGSAAQPVQRWKGR